MIGLQVARLSNAASSFFLLLHSENKGGCSSIVTPVSEGVERRDDSSEPPRGNAHWCVTPASGAHAHDSAPWTARKTAVATREFNRWLLDSI